MYKITAPGAKERFQDWIANRGGVVVWQRLDFSGRGPMFTPAHHADGTDGTKDKPHWSVGDPVVVTTMDEFEFVTLRELKRFHVAKRMGSQGMMLKLTDASSRRLERELDKAREKYGDAFYEFDYGAEKDCVILVPAS